MAMAMRADRKHNYAMQTTDRGKLLRLPQRGSRELEVIHGILDAGFLAHIGFQQEGQPFVIPTIYGRQDERLYLHGSTASRMLRQLATGAPACVTVTLVDGLVLARSAFHHSMNYRSVVAFGTARLLEAPEQKLAALRIIAEHAIPGRWNHTRPPSEREINLTRVLEFTMEEATAKQRSGPPLDEEEDYELDYWAGVVPLTLTAGTPIADARLPPGKPVPNHLKWKR